MGESQNCLWPGGGGKMELWSGSLKPQKKGVVRGARIAPVRNKKPGLFWERYLEKDP